MCFFSDFKDEEPAHTQTGQTSWARYLDDARKNYFFYGDDTPTLRLLENYDDCGNEIKEPELWRPLHMDSDAYNRKIEVNIFFFDKIFFYAFSFIFFFCLFLLCFFPKKNQVHVILTFSKKKILLQNRLPRGTVLLTDLKEWTILSQKLQNRAAKV